MKDFYDFVEQIGVLEAILLCTLGGIALVIWKMATKWIPAAFKYHKDTMEKLEGKYDDKHNKLMYEFKQVNERCGKSMEHIMAKLTESKCKIDPSKCKTFNDKYGTNEGSN